MNDNSKPGMAFWATAAMTIVLVALYPLSLGPVCWLQSRGPLPSSAESVLSVIYKPLEWLAENSETVNDVVVWYAGFWIELPSIEPTPYGPSPTR